jgi:PAS domain S-box-containing protein
VTSDGELLEDAPCGYLLTALDGTILRVNRTFEALTGRRRDDLIATCRFDELLSPGGRIYHETHYAPLLRMQQSVSGIAVEFVCANGSRLPALINAVVQPGDGDRPPTIATAVFDATDRRSYERELVAARQREQEIAGQLQRSLLAGDLPADARLDLGVAYRSAVAGLDVGGDWYDAFWVGDDTVGLVVGDVVGRGIEAAATMGQLRSAVRALAATASDPGKLLSALDVYSRRYDVGQMATVVYAELHLTSGALRYACAGHPPPLLTQPGEEPVLLWEGRSPPLDALSVAAHAKARETGIAEVEPGAALLLYTDGLIERRTETLTEGLERLMAQVAARPQDTAARLVEGVTRSMADTEHPDDVCLLMARRAVE